MAAECPNLPARNVFNVQFQSLPLTTFICLYIYQYSGSATRLELIVTKLRLSTATENL